MDEEPIHFSPHRHPLRDEISQITGEISAPEIKKIPPLAPKLTTESVKLALENLPDNERIEILGKPHLLAGFTLSISDEWGRPYQTSTSQLLAILEQIYPNYQWNRTLRRNLQKFELLASAQNNSHECPEKLILTNYLANSQVFDQPNIAAPYLYKLDGPRFTNSFETDQLLFDRAWKYELHQTLHTLKPPLNSKQWLNYIRETINISTTYPEILSRLAEFTPTEIRVLQEMLIETEEAFPGRSLKDEVDNIGFKPLPPIETDSYDPSKDALDRYHLAMKFLYHISVNSQSIPDCLISIYSWMPRPETNIEDFVLWLANGNGSPPKWFFKSNPITPNPSPESRNHQKHFLEKLPVPIQPTRFIFTWDYQSLHPGITPDQIENLADQPNFFEIPIEVLDNFNTTMALIFKGDHLEYGERVANTIFVLAQKENSELNRIPQGDDNVLTNVKKLDAKGQRIGIYGVRATDKNGNRVFFLTAIHKKETRDRKF